MLWQYAQQIKKNTTQTGGVLFDLLSILPEHAGIAVWLWMCYHIIKAVKV
jgi:hypothetical protein